MEKINNNFEVQHLAENLFLNLTLADNPNAPNEDGDTPIYCAAKNGQTEIVKILAPLTNNPNLSDEEEKTPIYWAAMEGQTEIIKILAPLTDNPNAPDNDGDTPISLAVMNGNTEIVKILNAEIRRILRKRKRNA